MRHLKAGIVAAAACAALATGAAPAQAASAQGCGGMWTQGTVGCAFTYDGGSIHVRIGKDSGVFGAIRLESGSGADYQLHLVCDALFAPCMMASFGDEIVPLGTELRCITDGAIGTGRFSCTSGEEFGA